MVLGDSNIGEVSRDGSHGPAMAYMSHGSADVESPSEVMDSGRRPTSEILAIFMGQPTSVESERRRFDKYSCIKFGKYVK